MVPACVAASALFRHLWKSPQTPSFVHSPQQGGDGEEAGTWGAYRSECWSVWCSISRWAVARFRQDSYSLRRLFAGAASCSGAPLFDCTSRPTSEPPNVNPVSWLICVLVIEASVPVSEYLYWIMIPGMW